MADDSKKPRENDPAVADLNMKRIRKRVLEETDPECADAVEDFLNKYKSDTLTGL